MLFSIIFTIIILLFSYYIPMIDNKISIRIFLFLSYLFILYIPRIYNIELYDNSSYNTGSYKNTSMITGDKVVAGTVYTNYNIAEEDPGLGWIL